MTTKKRLTKEQREAQQKAALRQRIADIVCGACGRDMDTEDDWVTVEELPNVIGGLTARFSDLQDDKRDYMTKAHCMDKYGAIDSITDFFWDHRVRA